MYFILSNLMRNVASWSKMQLDHFISYHIISLISTKSDTEKIYYWWYLLEKKVPTQPNTKIEKT